MGIDAYGKTYCHVQLLENGRVTNRRICHLMVQDADGRVHHLEGDQLPEFFGFGNDQRNPTQKSFGEILLRDRRDNLPQVALVEVRPRWPKNRDILHMALPIVALGFMKLAIAFAQQ